MSSTPAEVPDAAVGARPGARGGEPVARSTIAFLAFLGVAMAVGVDIALPAFHRIADGLSIADPSRVSLVGTTYFLGMATGQLVFGPASDRFGRTRTLRVGLALATVGALASMVAPRFGVLLAARAAWGLGAAAPAVLRFAIARDLFDGDRMARVVTTVQAVFLLGPIVVPLIGQAVLAAGPWRAVFGAATLVTATAFAWTTRFPETLDPEHRRPLDVSALGRAFVTVAKTRTAVGHMAAQTFTTGAFIIFLGSSQRIVDRVYGRASLFGVIFAGAGTILAVSLTINARLIRRFGARTMVLVASCAALALAATGLAAFSATGGRPPLLVWFVWVAFSNTMFSLMTPMCQALALEPMGALAGSASAIHGFVTMAGGALLASIFDSLIDRSVTPMAVGYTLYSGLALVSLVWARRPQPSPR